jgi:hypothetical protein
MKKLAVAICAAAVLIVGMVPVMADGRRSRTPVVKFTDKLGSDTAVAPQQIGEARAKCPHGYVATGGGSYAGAIEHVVDGPTGDGKGWFVDGFNPSTTSSFSHSVVVRCAKGARRIRVNNASASRQKREALDAFLETHRH